MSAAPATLSDRIMKLLHRGAAYSVSDLKEVFGPSRVSHIAATLRKLEGAGEVEHCGTGKYRTWRAKREAA